VQSSLEIDCEHQVAGGWITARDRLPAQCAGNVDQHIDVMERRPKLGYTHIYGVPGISAVTILQR
jgi:hypothetical protein